MRFRLTTSRTAPRPGPAPGHLRKQVSVAAGETLELCRMEGSGRIVRLWCTLPVIGQRLALKDLVLRMYWDGEARPSVESPLGDFFGASFGRPLPFVSEKLVIAGGGYLSRFEMPFNRGARLELANDSHNDVNNVFFQVGWYEEPTRTESLPTLHAQYRRQRETKSGEPLVLLRAEGTGWLVGLRLDIQGRDWWLKPPIRDIGLPRGFGLGLLEGWETIVVDGDVGAAVCGTGAEDYFSGGFYFRGAPFCTPTHGCTLRSFVTGRVSAYRFHLDDPIHFNQSLDFRMDHGLGNTMEGDYSSVVYWYQTEPHAGFPGLPSAADRRPTFPARQMGQWALCAGAAAAAGAAALMIARC